MKTKKTILLTLTFFMFSKIPVIAQSDTIADFTKQEAIVYSYPMHPETTLENQGSCPKCGMALTQKQLSSSDDKMGMMMCPVHGMMDMGHQQGEKKNPDSHRGSKMMGMGMGAIMVAMMVVMVVVIMGVAGR